MVDNLHGRPELFLHNSRRSGHAVFEVNLMEKPKDVNKKLYREDRPVPRVYAVIDTDLARDNLENDLPSADLQDF